MLRSVSKGFGFRQLIWEKRNAEIDSKVSSKGALL